MIDMHVFKQAVSLQATKWTIFRALARKARTPYTTVVLSDYDSITPQHVASLRFEKASRALDSYTGGNEDAILELEKVVMAAGPCCRKGKPGGALCARCAQFNRDADAIRRR